MNVRTRWILCALFAAWLVHVPNVLAQLKTTRPGIDVMRRLSDIRDGNKPFKDPSSNTVTKSNLGDMNLLTQWLAYRVAQPELYGDRSDTGATTLPSTEDTFYKVVDDITKYMLLPAETNQRALVDTQWDYNRAFAADMVKHLTQIMKSNNMIVRVNAARMLSLLGKSGDETLADLYVKMIKDPAELEASKLYAIQGLRYLLMIPNRLQPNRPFIQKEDRLIAIVRTLMELIEGQAPVTDPNAPMAAVQLPAVRHYFRREAVRSLGALHTSVIRDVNYKAVVNPGFTLIRVALRDPAFVPMATPSEQVEAIIGFCSMGIDDELNLDYAAVALNLALIDLTRSLNNGSRDVPWKLTGVRLNAALTNFKTATSKVRATRDPGVIKNLVETAIADVLQPMETSGLSARPNTARLQELQLKTKSQSLFNDDPKTTLNPPGVGN